MKAAEMINLEKQKTACLQYQLCLTSQQQAQAAGGGEVKPGSAGADKSGNKGPDQEQQACLAECQKVVS